MYELTEKDKIWNRACQGGGASRRAGDTALASLLLFHGPAMNGGVLDAIECLTAEQLSAAKAGYKYYGFATIEQLINEAELAVRDGQDLEPMESLFDKRYWEVVPEDGVLVNAFEKHQSQHPAEYSPVVD